MNVRAEIASLADATRDVRWTLWVDDVAVHSDTVVVGHGSSEVLMFGQTLDEVEIWSPENPRLYADPSGDRW